MASSVEFVVEETAADLAGSVASRLVDALVAAQSARPLAHLVVTGGSILEAVLVSVSALKNRDSVDWSRVVVWEGDERFVPVDSPDRNDQPAYGALFEHVPIDPANMHMMAPSDGPYGDDADAAAAGYAAELAEAADGGAVPAFDVALIGMGPDGHCCSLFPGHPGVYVDDASVIAVHDSPKPPPTRLSLTFRTLEAAREVWVIASGSGKADAVAKAQTAPRTEIPVAGARGQRTLWLLDRDAAAQLPVS